MGSVCMMARVAAALIASICLSFSSAQDPAVPGAEVVSLTPLNLIATEVTASSVQLSWQTPESDMNHVIKEYQVLYRAQGNTQQIAMTRSSEPLYSLTGLLSGTEYEMWVVPLTTEGRSGEDSNRVTITTSNSWSLVKWASSSLIIGFFIGSIVSID